MMEWHDVESTNLKKVAYVEFSETLYIEFKTDRVYSYSGVPKFFFQQLLNSNIPDKGWYFNNYIRGIYAYQEVTELFNPGKPSEKDSVSGEQQDPR